MYIFMQILYLTSKRKGAKFGTSIPDQDPSKKAHLQDEIRAFLHAERHKFWEHHNYLSLHTRESSKFNPERQQF